MRRHVVNYPVLLAVALLCFQARAQLTVEEEVKTDSVDVFAYRAPDKSPTTAMLASVLLPGLGHQYLGRPQRAMIQIAAEASFVFGLIYCERYSQRLIADAKSFAWANAQVQGGAGADDYFWQNVGRYMDAYGYGTDLERNRTSDIVQRKYVADNLQWRWENDSLKKVYGTIRSNASRFQLVSTFFIAAMVINRVVAFIDVRASTRYHGIRSTTYLQFSPQINGPLSSVGLSLCQSF